MSDDSSQLPPGEAPAGAAAELSPDELREAGRYRRQELACTLIGRALDLAYLGLFAFFLAEPLVDWLWLVPGAGMNRTLRLAALVIIMVALQTVISLPLNFYASHILEHRFGLSRLSVRGWAWRYLKELLLGGALAVLLVVGLYWVIRLSGSWWWLVGAAAWFAVTIVLGQLLPVVILPLFYKLERLDAPELAERFIALTRGTGLSIKGIYRMVVSVETVKANAMLAGLGRTRRVILGDTLLDQFAHDEIEVIFAHEVGHHVYRHIWKLITAGLVTSAAGFWICDRILAWRLGAPPDYAYLPVSAMPLILFVLAIFSMLLEPLQNALSRHFERQCDRYALAVTGKREAFRSAFRRLSRLNKSDPNPPRLEVLWLHSHPPIRERLKLADD